MPIYMIYCDLYSLYSIDCCSSVVVWMIIALIGLYICILRPYMMMNFLEGLGSVGE